MTLSLEKEEDEEAKLQLDGKMARIESSLFLICTWLVRHDIFIIKSFFFKYSQWVEAMLLLFFYNSIFIRFYVCTKLSKCAHTKKSVSRL